MSSREAFCPLLAEENSFSHFFNSIRRAFDFSVNAARSSSVIFHQFVWVPAWRRETRSRILSFGTQLTRRWREAWITVMVDEGTSKSAIRKIFN